MLRAEPHPSLIKYMGSKTKLLEFVLSGINCLHSDDQKILDLFSGSATLAGALRDQNLIVSNDIQAYSSILANTYTNAYKNQHTPTAKHLTSQARIFAQQNIKAIPKVPEYGTDLNVENFNKREQTQRDLIYKTFKSRYHLFTKNYSGTWWSAEQAAYIDALKQTADQYANNPIYPAIMSSIMFAMAYTSIGTGHYAQYRDATSLTSMRDIELYRKKNIISIFERKYNQLLDWLPKEPTKYQHQATQLDYIEAIHQNPKSLVYADPPYCFVHYSRFYHALESLTLYDYPKLQIKNGNVVKGRYRENRHQSPFCIKSQVANAFKLMFDAVNELDCKIVLSYSNTGMITIDEVIDLAAGSMPNYEIKILTTDYKHMTLGRLKDRERVVTECLILAG